MSYYEFLWVLMIFSLLALIHLNPFEPIVTHRLRCAFSDNNNQYISDKVGKCNRLDKCGYHYTPREYFSDNSWLRDKDFYIHTEHRGLYVCKIENPAPPKPVGYILMLLFTFSQKTVQYSESLRIFV